MNLSLVTSLFRPAATATLVAVLVIFMLLRRENLRDRLLRVAGYGQLAVTTKAIDEAGKEVSRFLLCQFLVNSGYGITVGVGLSLIGFPYAPSWGIPGGTGALHSLCRSSDRCHPARLMSLAVFSHWRAPLRWCGTVSSSRTGNRLSVGSRHIRKENRNFRSGFADHDGVLDVVVGTTRPRAVRANDGLSDGDQQERAESGLKFISLMLSREPAMETHRVLYHRLIARDEVEAKDILEKFLAGHSRSMLFDQVLIPTLICCRRDFQRHRLTGDDRRFVSQFIRRAIESPAQPSTARKSAGNKPWLLACPATG